MQFSTRALTLLMCGFVGSAALAGPLPKRFSVGRYVPADVWLYMHNVHNPERAWLDDKWADVLETLKSSGVQDDVASLILSFAGEDTRDKTQTAMDKWSRLIQAVHWRDLIGEEFVFAERLFGTTEEPVDYFLLTRGKAGTADANIKALVAILKEVATFGQGATFTKRRQNGIDVWSLGYGDTGSKLGSFSLQLFQKGDVIGATSGPKPLGEVLALMNGQDERPSIASSPRLAKALSAIDAPEQTLVFIDIKMLVRGVNRAADKVAGRLGQAVGAGGDDAGKRKIVVGGLKKALALCDVMDFGIATVEMQGRRELVHQALRFQANKRKCSVSCCLLDRKPFKRFDRYIPADATDFSASGLLDFEKLYGIVIDFARDSLPDGEKHVTQWNDTLASLGFDPKRDLFSWWSGEMVSVTLPPAVVTPMSSADWVYLFRVKNEDLAIQKIAGVVDFMNGKLQGQGQGVMMTPAAVNADGFRQITHPLLMMMARPVFGVKDGWLMIGSSPDSINRCLAVADGTAPSVLANERFQKEGLIPRGPVVGCSFKDTSEFGQKMGTQVGMIAMAGPMLTASLPDGPETQEIKRIMQFVARISMKLAPALRKINFYSSESSVQTYDGSLTLRTESVTTYKPDGGGEIKTALSK